MKEHGAADHRHESQPFPIESLSPQQHQHAHRPSGGEGHAVLAPPGLPWRTGRMGPMGLMRTMGLITAAG
jgi:hypothetical protein